MESSSLSKTEEEELIICFYFEFQRINPYPKNSPSRQKWEKDRFSFLERRKQEYFNNPLKARKKLEEWRLLKKNLSPLE